MTVLITGITRAGEIVKLKLSRAFTEHPCPYPECPGKVVQVTDKRSSVRERQFACTFCYMTAIGQSEQAVSDVKPTSQDVQAWKTKMLTEERRIRWRKKVSSKGSR